MRRWLAVDQDDGSIARELLALGSSRTQLCQYKLQVTTSDVRFAGTDSGIFFELKGMSTGQSRLVWTRLLLLNRTVAGTNAASSLLFVFGFLNSC